MAPTVNAAPLLTAALALARQGWRVFPLAPGGKRPAFAVVADHDESA